MYELKQVGPQTYYINCPAKIGVYVRSEYEVCFIDSGNDMSGQHVSVFPAQHFGVELLLDLSAFLAADGTGLVLDARLASGNVGNLRFELL